MSKTRSSLDHDVLRSGGDFEYAAYETLQDKRAKNRRQTEIRRRMENRLEQRRLSEQLGLYLDEVELEDFACETDSAVDEEGIAEDSLVDSSLIDDFYFDDAGYSPDYPPLVDEGSP